MLEPPPVLDDQSVTTSRQTPRVVIIDFVIAKFQGSTVPVLQPPPKSMSRWWHGLNNAVVGQWVPLWWELDFPRRRQWLLQEFGGKRAGTYQECLTLCGVDELNPNEQIFLQQMKLGYANK